MYNALIALMLGLVTTAALTLSHLLTAYEATLPGVLVALVALFVLARRTFGKLEHRLRQTSGLLQQQPPRVGAAVASLRRAYVLAPWQFGLRTQLDAQLGMLQFMQGETRAAEPLLRRAYLLSPWLAGAMLAVIQYRHKDVAAMRKTMAVVTRKAKKQGLAWNLYAYMLDQLGERAAAMRVLSEGSKAAAQDPRVKESLLALQNGRKMKLRGYHEQWYQFQLERPPISRQDVSRMGRGMRQAQARGRL